MEQKLFNLIYASVLAKEHTYDGIYYTCVRTTRIFCRPSCRARTPYPQNVRFVNSPEEAIELGYRPCKRCKPEEAGKLGPDEVMAAKVDDFIEQDISSTVTLKLLSSQLAVSPFHLQKVYRRVRGYSPAEYLQRIRIKEAKRLLVETALAVSVIAGKVGFSSPSHFTVWFKKEAGCSPRDYRELHRKGDTTNE